MRRLVIRLHFVTAVLRQCSDVASCSKYWYTFPTFNA